MEDMQDTYAKVPEFIWGGWDKWGAQEGSQCAEMTQGGNSQVRGRLHCTAPHGSGTQDTPHPRTQHARACKGLLSAPELVRRGQVWSMLLP